MAQNEHDQTTEQGHVKTEGRGGRQPEAKSP